MHLIAGGKQREAVYQPAGEPCRGLIKGWKKTGHDLHIDYVDVYKNMFVIWTLS